MKQVQTGCLVAVLFVMTSIAAAESADKYGTITEQTPSIPEYFSWINNTNEGPTEEHTLTNLRFFKWLHDEYGMQLGIYAFDAGTIDSAQYYGNMTTERFRSQFPQGFANVAKLAKSFGCHLGLWGGPDGFGETAAEEKARTEMLVSLVRDYGFRLFKLDAVCGQLRDEKQDAFANAMALCRKHAPDLIVLNHRLKLSEESKKHMTTFLMGGRETYIDVHMTNNATATHNRQGALARGLPPDLLRLTEDHGVCISSCLDFWEDDLVLQGFNRCLILAPQTYGNPWLLRDEEFAKLARIYNLHYRNREILVEGMVLPESYGPNAVARGNDKTRFVTLRNLTWYPVTYSVKLDGEIGLKDKGQVEVRRYHPSEQIIGTFQSGSTVRVTVDPFRSCLILATTEKCNEIGVEGCAYEVVRDTPGKPVKVKLLGMPGDSAKVALRAGDRKFTKATIDGKPAPSILDRRAMVTFPGEPVDPHWHAKLADLKPVPVPADAEQLYEVTCFTAPNDALEVQSLRRSGPSNTPQVQAARKAFFEQELFWRRGIWDKYMFDGNNETFFSVFSRHRDKRLHGGCLRLDLGKNRKVDTVYIRTLRNLEVEGENKFDGPMTAEVSSDLKTWRKMPQAAIKARSIPVKVAHITHNGGQHEIVETQMKHFMAKVPDDAPWRYLRITPAPMRVAELELLRDGQRLMPATDDDWHATMLFAPYEKAKAERAWQATINMPSNPAAGSYLCVAVNGKHGRDGAFAALRLGDQWIGASQRAISFPAVVFEYGPRNSDTNYTFYFPITPQMKGRELDVVLLGQAACSAEIQGEVWTTTYPNPYTAVELELH